MINKNTKKNINGFTIIEVLVSMAIFSMVGLAIWSFQKDIFSFNDLLSDDLDSQRDIRHVLREIGGEVRSISPSSIGSYGLAKASTTTLTFYSNIDADPVQERVRYFLDGTTLKKGILNPTGNPLIYEEENEVINNLALNIINDDSQPIFEYYDSSYNGETAALTQPVNITDVRLIKMTLYIDDDVNRSPATRTVTTQMSMRNIKDNL